MGPYLVRNLERIANRDGPFAGQVFDYWVSAEPAWTDRPLLFINDAGPGFAGAEPYDDQVPFKSCIVLDLSRGWVGPIPASAYGARFFLPHAAEPGEGSMAYLRQQREQAGIDMLLDAASQARS